MIKVGESYEAEELAKLCGQEEDERYGHHAFVGERATVIAQDEGNGVVKVVQIISQTPERKGDGMMSGDGLMKCNVCHQGIKPGEPCYQLRQGGIEEDNITFLPDEDAGYYHQLCLVGLP